MALRVGQFGSVTQALTDAGCLLSARVGDTEKSLTLGKNYWAKTKTSVCYLHYSHTEIKAEHWEEN